MLLGWLVLVLSLLQLGVVSAARARDRATGVVRLLDATTLVVVARLVGPWDVVPPVVWGALVAGLVVGLLRLAAAWSETPPRTGGRVRPAVGLAVSGALLGLAGAAAVTAAMIAA